MLPVFLLTFFGMIDAGRFFWSVNQAEKATQVGARWAAVTDMVPSALSSYSFAVTCAISQGLPFRERFPRNKLHRQRHDRHLHLQCFEQLLHGSGKHRKQAAFNRIVNRMRR